MALMYKFPKLYKRVVEKYMPQLPGVSIPQDLAEKISLDRLSAGMRVLDLACGEGTLTLWLGERRPDLRVTGLDLSQDMLARAREKLAGCDLDNVSFLEKSATCLEAEDLLGAGDEATTTPLHMVICSHGFSAMDDYRSIFEHTLSLLSPGGLYVIVDLYYPKRTLVTLLASYLLDRPIFGANQFRRPFEALRDEMGDFAMHEEQVTDFGFIPGVYYVARGVKPA